MSRRRYISTTMAVDKRLNLLAGHHGDFAALLYTWMVPHAEDDGAIDGDLDEFMATVIPMRRDKSREDVLAALSGMAELGLIEWDGEGSQIQFPVETFYRHQSYITAERRKVATERRESARISAEQRKTPQNAALFKSSSSSLSKSSSLLSPDGESAPEAPTALETSSKRITESFRAEMRTAFPDLDEAAEYEKATNHIAYRKAIDKRKYYRIWMTRAREFAQKGGTNGRTATRGHSDAEHADQLAYFRSIAIS